MEWDWQFLTPSSTPTDATFDCHPLQTPNPNAHFQDAFSPYLGQNGHLSAAPGTIAMDFHENNYIYPQENGNMQWMQVPPMQQQPQQQQQQPSHHMPGAIMNHTLVSTARMETSHQRSASCGGFAGPDESYQMQMQTPPPTRGSPTKRRSQRIESVVFGTPSSMPTRRPQSNQHMETNHVQHTSLQQSPGNQVNPLMPPASFQIPTSTAAPEFMPQQTASWAQSTVINPVNHTPSWPSLDDPFNPWSNPTSVPQNTDLLPVIPRSSSHASLSFPSTSLYQQSRTNGPYTNHASSQRTAGVDPSLVFSSPTRPVTAENPRTNPFPRPSSSSSSSASSRRIPYEHQLQSSRREMDSVHSTRSKQQPTAIATTQPALAPPTLRPGLQRSNTTGGTPSNNNNGSNSVAASVNLSRSSSAAGLSRRASPLKRTSRASLCSISETPKPAVRTSVVLTVDANGRARTEIVEDSTSKPIKETSPSKSMREKYPTLWDDSDSESDSAASKQRSSRNSSLTHSKSDERQPKVTKLEPPSEGIENLHLLRSNSTASLKTPSKAAYAAAAQIRRQSSVKKQQRTTTHSRRNTLASLNSSFESLGSFDVSTDDRHPRKDAGSALREVVPGRTPQKDQQIQPDPILPHNTTRALQPPNESRMFHQKSQSFAAPPTTQPMSFDRSQLIPVDSAPMQPAIHFHTGSPNDMMRAVTRCICNFPLDDGRGMLQCSYCSMWLHATCLGLDPQRLPASYACSFCTNPAQAIGSSSSQNFAPWGVAGI